MVDGTVQATGYAAQMAAVSPKMGARNMPCPKYYRPVCMYPRTANTEWPMPRIHPFGMWPVSMT